MIELAEKDMKQISEMGITKEKILLQIDIFKKGIGGRFLAGYQKINAL